MILREKTPDPARPSEPRHRLTKSEQRLGTEDHRPDSRRRHRARGRPTPSSRSSRQRGAPLAFEEAVVGREAEKARGRSPAAAGPRGDPAAPRRAQGAGRHADRQGLRLRQRPAAPGARPLREPAARQERARRSRRRFEDVDLVIVRENTEDLYAGSSTWSCRASSSRSRSSPRPLRRGSRATPSSTRAGTAAAASRPSTRPTS